MVPYLFLREPSLDDLLFAKKNKFDKTQFDDFFLFSLTGNAMRCDAKVGREEMPHDARVSPVVLKTLKF